MLNLRPLLEEEKFVFLIGDEISQYPIDFKERFGIDYSQYSVKPIEVKEVTRLIWHTQLSSHNGGDFFNEVFDEHPNLLCSSSIMFDDICDAVERQRALQNDPDRERKYISYGGEWYVTWDEFKSWSEKDFFVGLYLGYTRKIGTLDESTRIVPALFFQPHFPNSTTELHINGRGEAMLEKSKEEKVYSTPFIRAFKYIKTFTPLRRPTTSYAAMVKYSIEQGGKLAEQEAEDGKPVVAIMDDAISQRVIDRSTLIDVQNRMFRDSVLVRFEDGKLNPKATFTALTAFLDLPYTETMTYCSLDGKHDPETTPGNTRGFDPASVYRTYDAFANDSERCFLEYFMRDIYATYGYDFQYYDGKGMDEQRLKELVADFSTLDGHIMDSWLKGKEVLAPTTVNKEGAEAEAIREQMSEELCRKMCQETLEKYHQDRLHIGEKLLQNPRFVNKNGQPLRLMPKLQLDPALLETELYH